MSTKFLSIQGSYKTLEISLFSNDKQIDIIKDDNKKASSTLIPYINNLLNQNNLTLDDLNFIAIDQGPGAFTSLRVAITVVNSISFAKKIPLIGVDGLDALAYEILPQNTNIIALLNAYNNDVYYGIYNNNGALIEPKGYRNIDTLISRIKIPTIFTGNAAIIYKDKLNNNIIEISEASTKTIGLLALEKWNNNPKKIYKLLPLYLKTQQFQIKQ